MVGNCIFIRQTLFIDLQQRFHTSVIIMTHDMNIAKQAQRQMLLDNGKLVLSQKNLY